MFEKWKEFYDDMAPVVWLIGLLISMVLCLFLMLFLSSYNSCQVYEEMGITVKWDFWTGCMANHSVFGWVPVDEYFEVLNLNIPQ